MQPPDINLTVADPLDFADSTDKATCGICKRQVSRYTCPSCNVSYCSLTCFRSNEHAQCSESFYKKELELDIQTKPTASMEERKRMLEVLRKFEEEAGDEFLEDNSDDADEAKNNLAERLGDIDLGSASASDIWKLLTPEEREAFSSKIIDPSPSDIQELLRNAGMELGVTLPWWEAPETIAEESDASVVKTKIYGKRPTMEQIPETLFKRHAGPDNGPPLLYNICAVFVAYSYATRRLGISPLSQAKDEDDQMTAKQLVRDLVPFLSEKRSAVLFNSMDDVVAYLWPRLIDKEKADRASFVVCLRDAARLFTPRRVTLVQSASINNSRLEDMPQRDALLTLSDLITLSKAFRHGDGKETPTSMKLRFYAAHIATLPLQLLAAFSAEIGMRARSIEAEGESNYPAKGESSESKTIDAARSKRLVFEEM